MPKLYAVKHNPFVYFANVQNGSDPELSLNRVVDFHQLYADLKSGRVPNYSLIAPNQCHDQHGRGSSEMGTGCSVDQNAIAQGDAALNLLVQAIKSSRASGKVALGPIVEIGPFAVPFEMSQQRESRPTISGTSPAGALLCQFPLNPF
jgi:hypothetical protein